MTRYCEISSLNIRLSTSVYSYVENAIISRDCASFPPDLRIGLAEYFCAIALIKFIYIFLQALNHHGPEWSVLNDRLGGPNAKMAAAIPARIVTAIANHFLFNQSITIERTGD